MASNFLFGEDKLTVSAALDLVNGRRKGILSEVAKERILKGEQHVRAIVDQGSTVYGINTGFGILANTRISKEDARLLQEKILQSHSVGVGSAMVFSYLPWFASFGILIMTVYQLFLKRVALGPLEIWRPLLIFFYH
jgi:histidine ammonia-lyase